MSHVVAGGAVAARVLAVARRIGRHASEAAVHLAAVTGDAAAIVAFLVRSEQAIAAEAGVIDAVSVSTGLGFTADFSVWARSAGSTLVIGGADLRTVAGLEVAALGVVGTSEKTSRLAAVAFNRISVVTVLAGVDLTIAAIHAPVGRPAAARIPGTAASTTRRAAATDVRSGVATATASRALTSRDVVGIAGRAGDGRSRSAR